MIIQQPLSLRQYLLYFGVPLMLFATLILVVKSPLWYSSDALNLAFSIDLLLTIPLVYYFLIRKSTIPNTTIIPVMVLGLIIGFWILPSESQDYLTLFKSWCLPVVELVVLTKVVMMVRRAKSEFNKSKTPDWDFFDVLKHTCHKVVPARLVMPLATELAVLYYGFVNWKTLIPQKHEFTYHKESGTPALLGAFIFIIVIETIALHLLIGQWSRVSAWVLSGLSIYTAFQIVGFARSLTKRPIVINGDHLILRYGILNEAVVSISAIASATASTRALEPGKLNRRLSPLGEMESHNVILKMHYPQLLIGLYGFKRRFVTLALHLDDPERFVEMMSRKIRC